MQLQSLRRPDMSMLRQATHVKPTLPLHHSHKLSNHNPSCKYTVKLNPLTTNNSGLRDTQCNAASALQQPQIELMLLPCSSGSRGPCPVDDLCQFATQSVRSFFFAKYQVHKFANAQTNECLDKRRKTMLPVSLAGIGIKKTLHTANIY